MLISGAKDRHKTLQRNAFALLVFLVFPLQDFVITLDSNIYFVPQASLLWMGIVELGHWCLYSRLFPINLSVRNLLCLKIHFLKNHHLPAPTPRPWNGGCIVSSMSMWDTLHHWQTNSLWMRDHYFQNQLENIVLCIMSSYIIMQLCVS